MKILGEQFLHTINAHCDSNVRFFVGYSGGLDSHVLLHLAKNTLDNVTAVHVNHQLQPSADAFEAHCRHICLELNIELIVRRVNTSFFEAKQKNRSISIEMFAREQRYNFLADYASQGVILIGHHQEDQAETVLLNLFRGSGIDGLCGMPVIRPFGEGQLMRPLINVAKDELENYAKYYQLVAIDDPTNLDTDFARNYLRHKVMPIISSKWIRASKKIAESANLLQASKESRIIRKAITRKQLIEESPAIGREMVRGWVKMKTGLSLSQSQTQEIIQNIMFAKSDATPLLHLNNTIIATRHADALVLRKNLPVIQQEYRTRSSETLVLPHGELTWSVGQGILQSIIPHLVVRFGLTGLTFHPHWRQHSQKLKKLFHEAGTPFWLRSVTPLIFFEDELVYVGNIGVSKKHYETGDGYLMPTWQIHPDFDRL